MKKVIITFLLIMLSLVFIVAINYVSTSDKTTYKSYKFSTNKWNDEPYERIYMIDDLKQTYDFVGMDKTKVINLLGDNECVVSKDKIIYTLGSKNKRIFTYSYYFEIVFYNNIVISTNVYMD